MEPGGAGTEQNDDENPGPGALLGVSGLGLLDRFASETRGLVWGAGTDGEAGMAPWMLIVGGGTLAISGLWLLASALASSRRRDAARRFSILNLGSGADAQRLPMRENWAGTEASEIAGMGRLAGAGHEEPNTSIRRPLDWSPEEVDWLLADTHIGRGWGARKVMTPDGPMVLTTPPFRLRKSIMNYRERAYARAVSVMLPSGFVMCPQVRLESILTPMHPDGRPVEDFRNWRRRVRMRAVDFVICRLPEWSPVVAMEIEREKSAKAFARDKMIDETLAEAGLPLIRCSGSPQEDWAMIRPYLKGTGVRHGATNGQASDDAAPGVGGFDSLQ